MNSTSGELTVTSRSGDCSPQGVMLDYITAVVAIAQILISVIIGMKSDNNSNNNNNNSKNITFYTQNATAFDILNVSHCTYLLLQTTITTTTTTTSTSTIRISMFKVWVWQIWEEKTLFTQWRISNVPLENLALKQLPWKIQTQA